MHLIMHTWPCMSKTRDPGKWAPVGIVHPLCFVPVPMPALPAILALVGARYYGSRVGGFCRFQLVPLAARAV